MGFSGPKKATPFAVSKMVAAISEKLKKFGFSEIEVVMKGVGSARDSALKSLAGQGFSILSIKDVTPIPHNGPRPPKREEYNIKSLKVMLLKSKEKKNARWGLSLV